jgi:YHS domain-containing protein
MKKILLFFVLVSFVTKAQDAASVALRQKHFLIEKGAALSGYDPVSYFTGKPQKGKIAYINGGITYKFASATNLETFKKNPTKYEPAYGGWCAYAMGVKGEKVEVDPENFKIVNGVLNLFYKNFFSNTLDDWNKEEAKLKKQADANWIKTYK